MLPFMQPKKMASVLIARHSKDGPKASHTEGEPPSGLIEASEAILKALSSKDATALANALYDAFTCCDAAPHVEGEHLGEGA